MIEYWKEVPFNKNYMVSNLGRIKSMPRGKKGKEKILKQNGYPYLMVDLCINGKIKKETIHSLVAKAFIQNPENKPQVNHIDGNKLNNNLENLEWVTRSENQKHSIKIGLRTAKGIKNSQSKLNEIKVINILNDNRMQKEIAKDYNISISTICDIKRGYSWTHVTGLKNIKQNCL